MNLTQIESIHDAEEKENLIQMVGFVIGKETFGVDILMVQEILRGAQITTIPDLPDFIEGVINLRGNIVPVIDLRKRLKLYKPEGNEERHWMVILNIGGRVAGFIVDCVTTVLKLSPQTFSQPPDLVVAGLKSQYIQGVCKMPTGLLIILDFNQILMVEEIKRLTEIKRRQISTRH
jgi:purine-binding chemotaxis protein CheW